MNIQVRYFASLRESLGAAETVEATAGCSVGALRDVLIARGGRHADVLSRGRAVRCALNQRICADDEVLTAGDELAFFPPVTGG